MKKVLLFLVALVATLSMNAQTTEIHNETGKVASYLGADVTVKFGVDGSEPTLEVYKGDKWQKTYKGPEYKVVSTPAEETFKAVYDTNDGANTLTFYYDAVDHSREGTVYDNLPSAAAKATDWGYHSVRSKIEKVVITESVKNYSGLTSTAFMFQGMTTATNISGAEYLYVSNVTDMSYMFMNFGGGSTNSHTTLNSVPDVSKWNTANVTNMTGMFWDYGNFSDNLTKVPDVSEWNTAKVTNMAGMFQQYGYSSINFNDVPKVSGWSTVSVEDMSTMFRYYGKNSTALTAVPDVCNWNTVEVKTMIEMFREYGASSTDLKAVPNVSGWNTSNVTKISNLFKDYGHASNNIDCTLDLSGWDLSKITGTSDADDVFAFTPKTFKVTIPGKTGDKVNEESNWYYGNGTNHIAPPSGMSFTIFGQGYAAVKAEAGVSGNKVKWVQLWEGGPKFAEYNVGVTDGKAESYGGYYAWGGTEDKNINDYNTGSVPLTGADDTATNLWGSNWRMPTEEELDALRNDVNCTCTWTEGYNGSGFNGWLCTGKGAYSSNSIFFPAAGQLTAVLRKQNEEGDYWSSTPNYENFSFMLTFKSDGISDDSASRKAGRSVRAVLKDPVAVTGVSLNKTELKVGKGNTETLSATVTPADATNKKVLWTSSDEKVATVDAYGKVTGVASGKCNITATTEDGGKTAICAVEVVVLTTGTAKATIGGMDVDVKWVQLWENGPKFAEKNVGASSATDVGSTMTFTDATKAGADYVWGANWCTPSQDQMDELLKAATSDGSKKVKCEYTQENSVWVFKFTGLTDGYTSNSVFFPAQEVDSKGKGNYWSATAPTSSTARYMQLYRGNTSWFSKWVSGKQAESYLVRPVLAK